MCSNDGIVTLLIILNRVLSIIQIIVPILVLIALSIALFKLVMNPEDKKLLKRVKNIFVALIVVFFIPMLVRTAIRLVTTNSSCLEEEQIYFINENYNPFKNVEYIESENNKKKHSIIQDPNDYEKGDEKKTEGLDAPKNGLVISNSNAVYFLNTGASSDSFVIQDGEHFGLIDTATSGRGNFIATQLSKLGVKKLDFILITHSHDDHVGGYSTVIKHFPVDNLIIKADGTRLPAHQGTYSNLIKSAKKRGTNICDAKNSGCQSFSLGNINFQLYNTDFWKGSLAPSGNHSRFDNANSLCAVATINGKRVYFSGDIGNYFGYNRESITAREVGDIDVYKVAHHGYVTFNNNQDALNYLRPEYAVVTNGKNTASIAINRVKRSNSNFIKAYYTINGTVTMIVNPDGSIKFYQ